MMLTGSQAVLLSEAKHNWLKHSHNMMCTIKVQLLLGFDARIQQLLDTNIEKKNPDITILSPYLSFFVKDLNGFYLEAGGRLNNHSEFGNHFTYSINPSYLINKDVKVFANLASAFRAPSLNELYGLWGSNPGLKPEKSYTWELGTQVSLINNILETRVVYFNRRIKDVITWINNRNENLNEQKRPGTGDRTFDQYHQRPQHQNVLQLC